MYKLLYFHTHKTDTWKQKSFIFPKLFFVMNFSQKPFDTNNNDDDNIVFNKSDCFSSNF